jgi:hydroxymethylbilane synthase
MAMHLATRGSPLALWQAHEARRLLVAAAPAREVEFVVVQSAGDKDARTELSRFGLTGIFTAEVDHAVLSGRAQVGVHSLKDVPTTLHPDLMLAGVLARGAHEDAFLSATHESLEELPAGARVATGSVRRAAMLLAARPDLVVVPIRGNVDTRLRKLLDGEADALILARAGLERLGLERHIKQVLRAPRFLPAPSQGIVGLVCRRDDGATQRAVGAIGDVETFAEALAERALLHDLHGGCNAPVGALARASENALSIEARVLSKDGAELLEDRVHGLLDDAVYLGQELARRLLARGAKRLVDAARER